MATTVKCVWIFRDGTGTGWQEIHYWNTSSDNPLLDVRLTNMVNVIAPARALLLGMDCQVIGARASYPRPGAVASLSKTFFIGGEPTQSGCSPALSLAAKWTEASTTRHKITHLRGFWDTVESNGEYHPENPEAPGWQDRLNAYKDALVASGYGWLTKDATNSKSGRVTNYVSSTDGIVTFTLQAPGMPVATIGQTVPVRISRLNHSNSPLNEELLVEVVDAVTLKTANQIAAGPFNSAGRFNYRATTWVGYNGIYDVSLGRRSQGRPFFQLPGRSRAKARY